MQEVLQAFGIDWRLIVIQVFNFALLMAALWYFLYTPVLNLIKERQDKIAKGVTDADEAAELREKANEERAETLESAHKEAEAVVARAETAAQEQSAEIVSSAEQRAESIVRDAHARGDEEKAKLKREAEAEVAKTAVLAAEKILREKQ